MRKITHSKNYRIAVIFYRAGNDVLANLFLRAAYGVK